MCCARSKCCVLTRRTRRPWRGGGFARFRAQSPARAFTLIELIAVVVIVSILAGVAAVSFDSLGEREIKFAARQTAEHLQHLREHAQSLGRSTWAVFDIANNTVELREDDPDDPGFAGSVPLVDPLTGRAAFIDVAEDFGAAAAMTSASFDGDDTFGFDWRGSPISTGGEALADTGTIVFNDVVTVSIHPDTGYVDLD